MTSLREPPEGRKAPIRPSANHYARMERRDDDGHPVDQAVALRLRHDRRPIRQLHGELRSALGARWPLFTRLEALENAMRIEREEAYFNIGYEHGAADARAQGLRGASGVRYSELADRLAAHVRERLVQARLPLPEAWPRCWNAPGS